MLATHKTTAEIIAISVVETCKYLNFATFCVLICQFITLKGHEGYPIFGGLLDFHPLLQFKELLLFTFPLCECQSEGIQQNMGRMVGVTMTL